MSIKIELQKDWDDLPSGFEQASKYFSGRKIELDQLKHIILHKTTGTLLISAPRGTGKTDLIYKSIKEAKDAVNPDNKNIIFKELITVVLNATQLGITTEVKEDQSYNVLTSLIKRTYSSCFNIIKDEKLKLEISKLFFQASSKEYKESYISKLSKEDKNINEELNTKLTGHQLAFNVSGFLQELISLIKPTLILAIYILISPYSLIGAFAAIVLVYLIYLLINGLNINIFKKVEKKVNTKKDHNKAIIEEAEIIYLKDNSYSNLEQGFKNFLINLNSGGYKIIFVIDELDKVDQKDPGKILEIINSFKALFNHSNALFIFISDEKLYDLISKSRLDRDTSSTLFNQRIFINRPIVKDIKEFLGNIIISPDKAIYDNFINYVIYLAKMDYYKIPEILYDNIDSYNEGKPTIEWDDSNTNLMLANKQTIISGLLEEGNYLYKQQSNKYKNETLIKEIYSITEKTAYFELEKTIDETDPDIKTIKQLRYDLAHNGFHYGIYDETEINVAGIEYYRFTPTGKKGKALKSLKELLEFEKEFLVKFNEFIAFIKHIAMFRSQILYKKKINLNQINEDMINELSPITGLSIDIFKGAKDIYDEYIKNPSKHLWTQEEIKTAVNELDEHIKVVVNTHALTMLKDTLSNAKLEVYDLLSKKELLDQLPTLQSYLIDNNISNLIVKHKTLSKIVIFLLNPPTSVVTNANILSEIKNYKFIKIKEFYGQNNETPKIKEDKIQAFSLPNFKFFEDNIRYFRNLIKNYS
jgi:hypothetical protein